MKRDNPVPTQNLAGSVGFMPTHILNYVHNNPYKDNRIKDPENYPYSSLRFLETGEGVLRIDEIDIYLK